MRRSIILKLLPLTESNLMARTLHQSYKTPVPAPVHIASGKLESALLSFASTNKPVNKVSCVQPRVIIINYISVQQRAEQRHQL